MMEEKLIGVLVWGIRNGFRNNWLSHNVDSFVMEHFNDEMRQICNSTIEPFYSVEFIGKSTAITIYNPNAIDHVQRRAYIGLSVVVPNGTIFENLKSALDEMLLFYKQRQANAMSNMITADQLLEIVVRIGQPRAANSGSFMLGNKLGHFQYSKSEDLVPVLNEPSYSGYKKVFFDDGNNTALKQIPGILAVQSFKKAYQVQILGQFDPNRFVIRINGKSATEAQFLAVDGDVVEVLEPKTNRRRQYAVSEGNLRISLAHDFAAPTPPKPPISGKSPGHKRPDPPNSQHRLPITIFFVLLSSLVGFIYKDYIFGIFKNNPVIPFQEQEGDSTISVIKGQLNADVFETIKPQLIKFPKFSYLGGGDSSKYDSALVVLFEKTEIKFLSIKGKIRIAVDQTTPREFDSVTHNNLIFLKESKLQNYIPPSTDTICLRKKFLTIYLDSANNSNTFVLDVLYVNLNPEPGIKVNPPDSRVKKTNSQPGPVRENPANKRINKNPPAPRED